MDGGKKILFNGDRVSVTDVTVSVLGSAGLCVQKHKDVVLHCPHVSIIEAQKQQYSVNQVSRFGPPPSTFV